RLRCAPGDGPARTGAARTPCVAPPGNRRSDDRPRGAGTRRDGAPARPPHALSLDGRGRDHQGARVTSRSAAGWLSAALERRFALAAAGATVEGELLAGLTTFLTMSYILLVNPVILGAAGMDPGAVLVATSLTAALASILVGLLANYPIAGAPGMGHNAFFAFTVCSILGYRWQEALAAVFLSGVLFAALATVGFRSAIVDAVPASLKHAIGAGIGLLITLLGLEWGGIVRASNATLLQLGDLRSPAVAVTGVGFLVMAVLTARRARGAILLGLASALVTAWWLGLTRADGIVQL